MIKRFLDWLRWEYGTCTSDVCDRPVRRDRARRHRCTGEVQFILWKKGQTQNGHTYAEDYWHKYDSSWWPNFRAEKLTGGSGVC